MWDNGGIDTEQAYEQDRQALARLLHARGEQHAAAIVAVSSYSDVCVDNWDGGQYEAILAVPPELYDRARIEFAKVIDKACARHEPLVTEELWERAQEVSAGRVRSREKPQQHPHPLKGTIACGNCGELLGVEKVRNA
jgi:hypothetical protein